MVPCAAVVPRCPVIVAVPSGPPPTRPARPLPSRPALTFPGATIPRPRRPSAPTVHVDDGVRPRAGPFITNRQPADATGGLKNASKRVGLELTRRLKVPVASEHPFRLALTVASAASGAIAIHADKPREKAPLGPLACISAEEALQDATS